MKSNLLARVTIGTFHRVSNTKPVPVSAEDMATKDAEVVRSVDRIMRKPTPADGSPEEA